MIKRLSLLLLVVVVSLGGGHATALTAAQKTSLYGDAVYYWGDQLNTAGACGTSESTTLIGNDNTQKAFNFFLQKGLSVTQTAAVVGNLMNESHLDPTILQKGGNSQNPNDAGTSGSDGWGIAQWSPGGKVIGLAQSYNISGNIYELGPQLELVWAEMSGPKAIAPTGYKDIVHDPVFSSPSSSLSDLVTDFQVHFESGDPGARQQDATQALAKYGGGAATATNSGSTASGNCTDTAANCTPSTTGTAPATTTSSLSPVRQNVVCLAQAELAYWKRQPGYTSPYPGFTFAATGFLKYSDQNYEEWCADFTSWIYKQAGDPFSGGASGGWRLPAVAEIQALGQAGGKFHWHPASSGYVPRPGDLAIHDSDGHVNIFISANGNVATYIGGDQGGVNQPSGAYGSKNPPSGSVVSTDTETGFYASIIGYVSPD